MSFRLHSCCGNWECWARKPVSHMGVGTGGHRGTCPLIILPSEIFLTQLVGMHSYEGNWRIKCSFSTQFSGSLRSPNNIIVTKKSTNLYVQIISPHLKRFCVSSKHSEGMQPTIQHPIPFINFQKYTRAPQTVNNTPVMNILKGYFYIILF